jgi:FKBP-type peptidyl-prolyl cis-trans isomerase
VDSNGSKKKYYTFYLKLVSFKSKNEYEMQKKFFSDQQRITDSIHIAAFLLAHSLNNTTTDSHGIVYLKNIINQGSLLQPGDTIKLNYTGSLIDGAEFDNSYYRKEPLVFIAGKKQVIDGLDIALSYFRKGEAGIIIIPSYLGYAEREVGKIPPNSVLVFNVEILP